MCGQLFLFCAQVICHLSLLQQDSNDCRSSLGQPGTSSELLPAESKGNLNWDEVPSSECVNKKGKIHQSDLESACPGKVSLKKNGIRNEMTPSTSEMDLQAKAKSQTMKSRQTHSGPLMQNVVLSHSLSDKVRISERLVLNSVTITEATSEF